MINEKLWDKTTYVGGGNGINGGGDGIDSTEKL